MSDKKAEKAKLEQRKQEDKARLEAIKMQEKERRELEKKAAKVYHVNLRFDELDFSCDSRTFGPS